MLNAIRNLLRYPQFDGISIDDPQTTILRKNLILSKPFLSRIYSEWYSEILLRINIMDDKDILELGSGAGFMQEVIPQVIPSDIIYLPDISMVADATNLPIKNDALNAIVMCNVLHHLPNNPAFFNEATRCLCENGVIIMVEPWNNWWSRLIYKYLHHEPFEQLSQSWSTSPGGPLSEANGAIPWIIFNRDRNIFTREYSFEVVEISNIMPFSYLLSGGVSIKSCAPGWAYKLIRSIELPFEYIGLGMFSIIKIQKKNCI